MLTACSSRWTSCVVPRIPSTSRSYAISLQPPKVLPGKRMPRVFKDKKAFQYSWYMRLLNANATSPILILYHNDFSAHRLKKLRVDILAAAKRTKPSLSSPAAILASPSPEPVLTVVRTSIFGATLRDLPDINLGEVEKMFAGQSGAFALLTLPSLDPPQLSAILRAIDRSVPPRQPKTEEDIKAELAAKNADPAQPGRRIKRQRETREPELRLIGALIEGKVFLPQNVKEVSKLPTLDTLRAQIVGVLSAPATQLAMVLSEASGGKLARTLEGLKKGLEDAENEGPTAS